MISGSFSANGSSALQLLRPGEEAALALSCAGADTFVGTAFVESSRDGGQSFQPERDKQGVLLSYTGITAAKLGPGVVAAATIRNTRTHPRYYRITVTGFDDDNLVYAVTPDPSAIIESIVSDSQGRPLFGIRADGGMVALRQLFAPSGLGAAADAAMAFADVTISAADIVATGAGKFGHAAGYPLVAAGGADIGMEFVSAIMVSDRATAAYTDGGNITVNLSGGGAALSGLVSAANSLGAATDKVAIFRPLTVAGEIVTANKGLNLVTSAAFTNPGTAAGVLRIRTFYRIHTLGLV